LANYGCARLPAPMPIAADDLTVEHCNVDGPALNLWCVFRDGQALFIDARLEAVVKFARTVARDQGCTAWLIAGGDPIEITGHAGRSASAESN
jgi:hypothetical protein